MGTEEPQVEGTFLMSIKPIYASRILGGTKRIELRRSAVRLVRGDVVLMYASSPERAIVGAFAVSGVSRRPIQELWNHYRRDLGVSEKEYASYFVGAEQATAIEIGKVVRLPPRSLQEIRAAIPSFRPPQSYARCQGADILLGPGYLQVNWLSLREAACAASH